MNAETERAAPRIEIRFCPACRWWLRAGWMAQEVFATYGAAVGELALIPAESGHFSIRVGDALLWERKRDGGFPEPKVLKQLLQPLIAPEKDLGHSGSAPAAE